MPASDSPRATDPHTDLLEPPSHIDSDGPGVTGHVIKAYSPKGTAAAAAAGATVGQARPFGNRDWRFPAVIMDRTEWQLFRGECGST